MIMKIDEIYLKEALRIRNSQESLQKYGSITEQKLNNLMIEIENIYKNNFKDIEKIDTSNMEAIQNELNNMFNKMETKAYKMDQSLQPYKELYEKNQKDADVLWQNLIIKYPNLSVEDIKDEIQNYININSQSINL